jgi:hypothetical protein
VALTLTSLRTATELVRRQAVASGGASAGSGLTTMRCEAEWRAFLRKKPASGTSIMMPSYIALPSIAPRKRSVAAGAAAARCAAGLGYSSPLGVAWNRPCAGSNASCIVAHDCPVLARSLQRSLLPCGACQATSAQEWPALSLRCTIGRELKPRKRERTFGHLNALRCTSRARAPAAGAP